MTTGPGRGTRSTLRDVAAAAGVSTATVSYVLSGRRTGTVGSETAARVRQVATELGYRTNRSARAVRTGRTEVLALSLTLLADPWSQSVVDAVAAAADPAGLSTLVVAGEDRVGGLFRLDADAGFIDSDAAGPRRLKELAARMALVVFSETLEPDGYDVIRSYDVPGCRLAMAHLLVDHTRIGCLGNSPTSARTTVWIDAMRAAGLEPVEALYAGYRGEDALTSAYSAAVDLLTRPEPPTAIYACTDFAAIAAVNAAQALRMRVPEDVAVIGVGNARQTASASPSISTVGPVGLFEHIAELLVARAAGEQAPPARHDFAWQLIVRDSSALPGPRNAPPEGNTTR